ncbi:MAG: metal-dependent transcriptional regulator [Chloroflexi bacterium]|nr:metal-dependent transcriptional regulator [Chloroflexota bacterium]
MANRQSAAVRSNNRAPHTRERISHAAQNYLLSLYILAEEGVRTTPGNLAEHIRNMPPTEHLGASLPSVLGMIRRMTKEGLVEISPQKEVHLTRVGRTHAESMVRRHRLAERMVVDLLGLELYKAHVEAHQLEHAISPDVEDMIRKQLGNPTTCPFGHPIPGSGYVPPQGRCFTLDQVEPGRRYVVERIPEEDQELLRFLIDHHIVPDQELEILEAGRYRGVISFRTALGDTALGYEAATRIWVRESAS